MKKAGAMSGSLQTKLLGSILELMAIVGVPEAEIRSSFKNGLVQSRQFRSRGRRTFVDGSCDLHGDVSAHLLRMWHRDARLINSKDSRPRPLSVTRGRLSLTALIAKLDSRTRPSDVIGAMKAVGLIRPTGDGRYLPTTNATVIPRLHPWVIDHTVRSIIRLISTVYRNSRGEEGACPLLERYSYVPDLDPTEGKAFAEFSRMQGLAYLDTLDDWLEQRRLRKPKKSRSASKKGVAAGVQVIAFLGDVAEVSPVRRKRSVKSQVVARL